MADKCTDELAVKAGGHLDKSEVQAASRMITECLQEAQSGNNSVFRNFIEKISENEVAGRGKDLSINYEWSKGLGSYLHSWEIR